MITTSSFTWMEVMRHDTKFQKKKKTFLATIKSTKHWDNCDSRLIKPYVNETETEKSQMNVLM